MLISTRALDIIHSELNRKNIFYIDTGNEYKIHCCFHRENTPSLFISKGHNATVGVWYCFGCGEKGNWNRLAEKLGCRKTEEDDFKAIGSVAKDLVWFAKNTAGLLSEESVSRDMKIKDTDFTLRKQILLPLAENIDWRGIPYRLLKKYKCVRYTESDTTYLVIPVTIDSEIKGCVKARWEKQEGMTGFYNSLNENKKWSRTFGLLGFDYVKTMYKQGAERIVFLTEGPRDALHLQAHNIPAIAILGIKNWSEEKREILLSLNPEKIVILPDNDKPGKKGAEKILSTFHGNNVGIENLSKMKRPPEDPAAMSRNHIRLLKNKYNIKSSKK